MPQVSTSSETPTNQYQTILSEIKKEKTSELVLPPPPCFETINPTKANTPSLDAPNTPSTNTTIQSLASNVTVKAEKTIPQALPPKEIENSTPAIANMEATTIQRSMSVESQDVNKATEKRSASLESQAVLLKKIKQEKADAPPSAPNVPQQQQTTTAPNVPEAVIQAPAVPSEPLEKSPSNESHAAIQNEIKQEKTNAPPPAANEPQQQIANSLPEAAEQAPMVASEASDADASPVVPPEQNTRIETVLVVPSALTTLSSVQLVVSQDASEVVASQRNSTASVNSINSHRSLSTDSHEMRDG